MERPTCETCPYWALRDGDEGKCVRFPPQLNETLVREGVKEDPSGWRLDDIGRESEHAYSWFFPMTNGYETCGEHPQFPAYIESLKEHPK